MIELNLYPGAQNDSPAESSSTIPAWMTSKHTLVLLSAILIATYIVTTTHIRATRQTAALATRYQAAQQDSAKLARIPKSKPSPLPPPSNASPAYLTTLHHQRLTLPQILATITESLPEYTWLIELTQLPADSIQSQPIFQLTGQTVDLQALARFMEALQSHPNIDALTLQRADLIMKEYGTIQFTLQLVTPPQ